MLTVTLEAYLTSSVDNNSNNICTPLHASLVTRIPPRVSCSPRKLRLQMTLVGASCHQVGLQRSAKPSEQTLL